MILVHTKSLSACHFVDSDADNEGQSFSMVLFNPVSLSIFPDYGVISGNEDAGRLTKLCFKQFIERISLFIKSGLSFCD